MKVDWSQFKIENKCQTQQNIIIDVKFVEDLRVISESIESVEYVSEDMLENDL